MILDTYEVGVVYQANPDLYFLNRPVINLILNSEGHHMPEPILVDLAERDESGNFSRSIIKVTDPDKYGITPGDAFV